MAANRVFRVGEVILAYAEIDIGDGLADGTFVTVAYDTDLTSLSKGADGVNCFVLGADEAGSVEFTLKAFSQANVRLSAIFQRLRNEKSGGESVTVRDMNGGPTGYLAEGIGLLTRPADMNFGKEIADVKWKVLVARLSVSGGGVV